MRWLRRLLIVCALVPTVAACTTDNSFEVDPNDNCYRTREQSFLGYTYSTKRVLALDTNCGGG